ncbi:MAG: L,D-transpeptidase [Polyangiaceae bacterium]|nr:L,D-transpeptidase [Polyangiaceae bacterium]
MQLARVCPLLLLLAGGAVACKGAKADVSLSKSIGNEADEVDIEKIPVPAENGPKLVAKKADVPVLERPRKDAPVVGALRYGAAVARADKPVKRTPECDGGYYPVRPRGFVCADASVGLDATSTLPAPDTSRALPYRYATVKSATPLYARMPTVDEQVESEPGIEKHLAKAAKAAPPSLRAGSNDVPVDERGVPTGRAVIAKSGIGVGADGKRTAASYFDFGGPTTVPSSDERASGAVVAMVLRRGSGVALVGSASGEGPAGSRAFGVTPDGFFVPIDRVDPALGSTFHGVDLTKEKGLPIGFVLRHEVAPYTLGKGKAERLDDEELERRSHVFLTGRFRTVDGVRYEEAEDGVWLRDKDLLKVVKRSKFPDFVTEGKKWLDVSLALQTMTLYEGKKPVYATLMSSGKDMVGDPATSASTQQGTFTVLRKSTTATLDPKELDQAYDVLDAPYAIEFAPGFAITGTYWSDPVGEARSFHNVALTPIDARRVFAWAGADVPDGFRWFVPREDEAITVHVRK